MNIPSYKPPFIDSHHRYFYVGDVPLPLRQPIGTSCRPSSPMKKMVSFASDLRQFSLVWKYGAVSKSSGWDKQFEIQEMLVRLEVNPSFWTNQHNIASYIICITTAFPLWLFLKLIQSNIPNCWFNQQVYCLLEKKKHFLHSDLFNIQCF